MKRSFIAALIGGIVIFIWQFLSWTVLRLHDSAQQYTPNQNNVMQYLGSQLKEGGYLMPNVAPNASEEEMKQAMQNMEGKPWAVVYYHDAWKSNMVANILRSLITDVITVLLLCIILSGFARLRFGNIFAAALFTGLIVFLNSPYTMHIWYSWFDISAHFIDALVSWGLCGLWLGWWFGRNKNSSRLTDD